MTIPCSSFCTLLDFKLHTPHFKIFISHELMLPQAWHSAYPMESFLGTVWRHLYYPFLGTAYPMSTGRTYACYGTIHLHRNMFCFTLPPFCPEQYMHIANATICSLFLMSMQLQYYLHPWLTVTTCS